MAGEHNCAPTIAALGEENERLRAEIEALRREGDHHATNADEAANLLAEARRERDEARAEVERWRPILDLARSGTADKDRLIEAEAAAVELVDERDAALGRVAEVERERDEWKAAVEYGQSAIRNYADNENAMAARLAAAEGALGDAKGERDAWKERAIGNANGARAAAYEHAASVIANHPHTCMTDKHCDFLHAAQEGAAEKLRGFAAKHRALDTRAALDPAAGDTKCGHGHTCVREAGHEGAHWHRGIAAAPGPMDPAAGEYERCSACDESETQCAEHAPPPPAPGGEG